MRVWPRLPCRRAELLKFADDLEITFDIASAYQTVQFICYGSFLLWFLKLFAQQDWSATVTRTLIGSLGEASGWVLCPAVCVPPQCRGSDFTALCAAHAAHLVSVHERTCTVCAR